MFRRSAITILTVQLLIAAVWFAALLAPGIAHSDNQSALHNSQSHQPFNDTIQFDFECSDRHAGSAFCNFRTDLRYSKYLDTPLTPHEQYSSPDGDDDQHRADLLMIFKLAVDEFNFLSGVRIYWELTEQNIEDWAIKLRLKGEIPINTENLGSSSQSQKDGRRSVRSASRKSGNHGGMMSLVMPNRIRWNLGMDPNDLTVFGELNLNAHLTLSGEVGDISQLGLYFKYAF